MLKGNKGEWSEIYTLLKLLSDKKVFVGDKNLDKIPDLFYPIIKILRTESSGEYEYSINDNLIIVKNGMFEFDIPIIEFKNKSLLLLKKIKETSLNSFKIPEIEEFLTSINCSTLKAKSSSKTDIRIVIHDFETNLNPTLGFSIKSQLGSPSTLLNAGKTTNFIYEINGKLNDATEVNSIDTQHKIQDRVKMIIIDNKLNFLRLENVVFENNLTLIDSLLPKIFSNIIVKYFSSKNSKISDLVNLIEDENPLNFNKKNNHRYYEYKIKRLLTESALGMMPSKVWDGVYDATGGYLVVKQDGEILSYHIYNKNKFEDYLYYNTKLDTPSSSKFNYGSVYCEDGDFYIKLNVQIRFTK